MTNQNKNFDIKLNLKHYTNLANKSFEDIIKINLNFISIPSSLKYHFLCNAQSVLANYFYALYDKNNLHTGIEEKPHTHILNVDSMFASECRFCCNAHN